MKIIKQILKELLKSKKILIICHVDSDGDTVWSGLALAKLLLQRKIQSKIVCFDPVPANLKVFSGVDKIKRNLPKDFKNYLVVALECGDKDRVGFNLEVDINMDHHFDNSKYGRINWIDPKASALASMLFQIAKQVSFKITEEVATLLYAAISSDTGGFRFGNTTKQTFADAYELVSKGAKPDNVYHLIYENVSAKALQKLGQALKNLKVIEKGQIVFSVVKQVDAETGHGIIDVIRTIKGTKVAILFKATARDSVKVSLRSKNKLNVQAIAKKFGGGGHKKAAGCELKTTLKEAKRQVLAEVKRKLNG